MAETYVTLSSLRHYDEKIKEVIGEKQDQLVGIEGQVVSFDADGNVISKDLEKIEIDTSDFVIKEEGKGLFSGSYNDLTDKPEIPSVEGLASEDYVDEKIDALVGEGASTTLDTIGEISKAIEEHQEVTDALNSAIGNKVDKVSGKGLSTNDLTSTLKSNYDSAYTHSQSTHAPTTAEKNVIVGIQKNGTDLSVNSSTRKVNITVPTKTSELTNDSNFKTTDNNTTYSLSKSGSTITLTGSDGSTTSVTDSNTTYSNFVKSGSSAKAGLVPAPSTTAGTTKYLREDGTWTTPPDTNTTYSTATQSAQGLMSASDKTKLDGIATGANKTTVDSALSSTSTNPVQNKVINSALSGKASTSVATSSANGLMSSTDKAKLDAITASADAVSVTQKLTSGTEIGTVTINGTGTKLYAPTNTDTHYASKNVVGSTSATSNTTTALTNGNVYLNSVENGSVTSTHKISGSGATTVTTDASGNIVITSTDNNTVTTATTTGSGNAVTAIAASNGALTVTKGSTFLTAHPTISTSTDTTSTATATHGGTVTMVDSVTRDSNGHVTKVNTKTVTLPSDNNTDTKVTNTKNNNTTAYLTGTTSSSTNTGTQVFDTGVYLGKGTGQLNLIGSASTNYSTSSQVLNIQIPSYTNALYGAKISPYTGGGNYLTGMYIDCGSDTGPGMRGMYINCTASNYQSTLYVNRTNTTTYAIQTPDSSKSYIGTIYSNSSTITTSDREKKTDIEDISEKYEELFFKLQPRLFKFKEGTSGRVHVGAIAQEVEEALNEVGISDTEFAGFVRQTKDYVVNEETGGVTQEEGYDYYLRYEEFIMLLCHMLQKLYVEKEEQDNKISDLESRIVSLESKLG